MFAVAALFLLSAAAATAQVAAPENCRIEHATASNGTVWVLCDYRQVLNTTDGGRTWRSSALPENLRFRTVAFLDKRRGFVGGDNGTLLHTADAGATWTPVKLPTTENITSLFFLGETGWATGWGGVILKSTDAGATWTQLPTGITQSLERVFFATPQYGWAAGWAGTLLRTTDGGASWKPLRTGTLVGSLNALYFRDENNGWVTAFGGEVLRTTDGGATWTAQEGLANASLTSMVFERSGRGWMAAGDRLLYSDDGWATSKPVMIPEATSLHTVVVDGDGVWAMSQSEVWRQGKGPTEWKQVELKTTPARKSS